VKSITSWEILFLMIVYFKFTGVVTWSWWAVIGFSLVPAAALFIAGLLGIGIVSMVSAWTEHKIKRNAIQRAKQREEELEKVRQAARDHAEWLAEVRERELKTRGEVKLGVIHIPEED
jgi:hypothetical protein